MPVKALDAKRLRRYHDAMTDAALSTAAAETPTKSNLSTAAAETPTKSNLTTPLGELAEEHKANAILFRLATALGYEAHNGVIIADPEELTAEAVERLGGPPAPKPAHQMVVELDRDTLVMRIVCNDEECMYRWTCAEDAAQCEVIYDVQPTTVEDGSLTTGPVERIVGYTHAASYYRETLDDDVEVRHTMVKTNECSFVEIAAGDPSMLPEMNEAATLFEVGRFAVSPVWMGEDGANWIRPEDEKRPEAVTP